MIYLYLISLIINTWGFISTICHGGFPIANSFGFIMLGIVIWMDFKQHRKYLLYDYTLLGFGYRSGKRIIMAAENPRHKKVLFIMELNDRILYTIGRTKFGTTTIATDGSRIYYLVFDFGHSDYGYINGTVKLCPYNIRKQINKAVRLKL